MDKPFCHLVPLRIGERTELPPVVVSVPLSPNVECEMDRKHGDLAGLKLDGGQPREKTSCPVKV